MVRSSKKKDKDKETASKTCTSSRKEQSATAGDEEEEASTSQRDELVEGDAAVTGDDDGSTQPLTSPFTAQQDEQFAAFFKKHKLFYDMGHGDYKNKKKRDHLVLRFAQSLFPSG